MRIHRRALPLGAILLSLGLAAPAAEGAKPILEKIVVDDEFVDEELSDYCGFEITGNAVGRVTARTFEGSDRIQLREQRQRRRHAERERQHLPRARRRRRRDQDPPGRHRVESRSSGSSRSTSRAC